MTTIADFSRGRMLGLNRDAKTAMIFEIKGKMSDDQNEGEQPLRQLAGSASEDYRKNKRAA